MWKLGGGIFLGWGMGGNDFANIFGPSVSTGLVRYRTAVACCSLFLLAGAVIEGPKCMATMGKLGSLTENEAFIAALAAALVMALLTWLALPASASQAIVGAVLGIGAFSGTMEFFKFYQVLVCWLLTPVAAALFSFFLYAGLARLFNRYVTTVYRRRLVLSVGVLLAGCYGSYSFGANNVANVTGVYVASGLLQPRLASLLGGLAIVSGVLTYSYRVMLTVGKKIVPLDAFSAFVATMANALVLHLFTQVGVPVSSSQAVVGAVVGVGLVKDFKTVSNRMIGIIAAGWLFTPLSSGLLAYGMRWLFFWAKGG